MLATTFGRWMLVGFAALWSAGGTHQEMWPSAASVDGPHPLTAPRHLDRRTIELAPGVTAEFVFIDAPAVAPDGFLMGGPGMALEGEEEPASFLAVLSRGYWLQTTEVTQAQWEAVMGSNPAHHHGQFGRSGGPQHPVEQVNWNDAQVFIERLRELGVPARLPTEAEWEFACRAGSVTLYAFGDDTEELDQFAWFANNSGRDQIDSAELWRIRPNPYQFQESLRANDNRTHPVATKKPNAWGLYDMHGNVAEWCSDWNGPYPKDRVVDPKGPEAGVTRVARGGTFYNLAEGVASSHRSASPTFNRNLGVGIRLVLDAVVGREREEVQPGAAAP